MIAGAVAYVAVMLLLVRPMVQRYLARWNDAEIPSWVLPAVVFLVMGFTTFATGGCWVMQVIAVPIFIPIALATGVPVELIIAPMMSGVTMGYGCCFYADSVFMAAAGTGVSNLRIIKTTLPYALGTVVVTTLGYLIVGACLI